MMTTESMWSKRPVLRFTEPLLFLLKLFLSHVYCIPIYLSKIANIMITDEAYAGLYSGVGGIVPCHPPFLTLPFSKKKKNDGAK